MTSIFFFNFNFFLLSDLFHGTRLPVPSSRTIRSNPQSQKLGTENRSPLQTSKKEASQPFQVTGFNEKKQAGNKSLVTF